jgi:hypothetical protein
MKMVWMTLALASFLVLAAPIHAEDADDTSKGGIEAPAGDETAPPVEPQPPAEPAAPDEDDDGQS